MIEKEPNPEEKQERLSGLARQACSADGGLLIYAEMVRQQDRIIQARGGPLETDQPLSLYYNSDWVINVILKLAQDLKTFREMLK